MSDEEHNLAFNAVILVGGIVFGFGLGFSHMAQPEIVLNFLQLADFGLLFVMGGAAVVTMLTFGVASRLNRQAPLTGTPYGVRVRSMDRNVLIGGAIFGVGWGLSGICPGAGYASLGVGNYPILWGIAGMFIGAYLQGYWRSATPGGVRHLVGAD